ncbi:MAG TPA: endolytic transglycosylase MltG, partial [Acidocella sp.]|nr:endolytic transglycosylase MltG [Acidocella sp.]
NRLRQGMKLQADPTVIYAATGGKQSGGASISRADLENPSPYNTYAHTGLPPGPICAPGAAAIDAVLHPANSDALYFVATGTGGHVFSRYFKDQLRNIEHLFDARR